MVQNDGLYKDDDFGGGVGTPEDNSYADVHTVARDPFDCWEILYGWQGLPNRGLRSCALVCQSYSLVVSGKKEWKRKPKLLWCRRIYNGPP